MSGNKEHGVPRLFWQSLSNHSGLIIALTRREILGRYKGSLFGLAWSFFNPLLMLGIYTFFFSYVMKARWGGDVETTHLDFAVILFAGLIVHGFFAECINRAPMLVTGNVNFVKKVVFPLDTLGWVTLFSAMFHMIVSIAVLTMMIILVNHSLPWTALWLPAVLLPLLPLTLGSIWFLAVLGVFVKDISQITSVFATVLLFMSPIFYALSALPEGLQHLALLNPLTLIVEQVRQVLVFGNAPDLMALLLYALVSSCIALAGFWWFQKMRKGFADVL